MPDPSSYPYPNENTKPSYGESMKAQYAEAMKAATPHNFADVAESQQNLRQEMRELREAAYKAEFDLEGLKVQAAEMAGRIEFIRNTDKIRAAEIEVLDAANLQLAASARMLKAKFDTIMIELDQAHTRYEVERNRG